MYQPHQGKHDLLPFRTPFSPERQLFLQGGNSEGESRLVISTDAKPRLKWTPELHEHFIEAVNQLGGPDKATPKTVMRVMGIPGLTLYHLKSHLQKYRLSKNLQLHSTSWTTKKVPGGARSIDKISEVDGLLGASTNIGHETSESVQISEAVLMQIEVQRQLNEQLEVQRHLQLRIEAQGKYLQSVLEKAQETLGTHNSGSLEIDAAKVQLSELVSNEHLATARPSLKGTPSLESFHAQKSQFADCSNGTFLTSCEGSQKNQEICNVSMSLMTYRGNPPLCAEQTGEDMKLERTQLPTQRCRIRLERDSNEHATRVRNPREGNGIGSEGEQKDIVVGYPYLEPPSTKTLTNKQEKGKQSTEYEQPYLKAQLDLNTKSDTDGFPRCKAFDLNGFGWS